MDKKGFFIGVSLAVAMIALLLASGAMFYMYNQVQNVVDDDPTLAACLIASSASRYIRDPIAKGQQVEWECPIDGPNKLDESDLDTPPKRYGLPSSTLSAYKNFQGYTNDDVLKYNANREIAEKMVYCKAKTSYDADTPLFSNWWPFMGISEAEAKDTNVFTHVRQYFPQLQGPPMICGICSVVYFDDDVFEGEIDKGEENEFNTYLQRHPMLKGSSESLWQGFDLNEHGDFFQPDMNYPMNGIEDYLVVYFYRLEAHRLAQWANGIDNLVDASLTWSVNLLPGIEADSLINFVRDESAEPLTGIRVEPISEASKKCIFANHFDDSVFS